MATESALAMEQYKKTHKTVFGPQAGPTCQSGIYILRDGKLVPAGAADIRKRDSVELKSEALAVHPKQIPDIERFYAANGVKGVKHNPLTGTAIFPDRRTKLKAMKARRMHDMNEICGGSSR